MQGNSTNTKFGSTKSKQRFKRDRKINPKEIMNCWTAGTTSGPALVSRSLKMCPADAHTTVFGHFSRPKEALNRYAEKICKYSMKEIQQRTKVMLELQQLKKNGFARPNFEYGDLELSTIHDGFWHFGEGSGNQFDCDSKVSALRLFWEISRREMQKGVRWFYASDSDCGEDFKWSGPTVRRVNFFGIVTSTLCVIRNTHV